jgi:hypothetical protein
VVSAPVPDGRTIVEVAVAWRIVLVIVVVEASDEVDAMAEGARKTATAASTVVKRILRMCVVRGFDSD